MPLRNINELHLETTTRCNLNCAYCYVCAREKQSGHDMSEARAVEIIERVIGASNRRKISVVFHGGEPLLLPAEWYETVCGHVLELAKEQTTTIEFSMQSNATRLTNEQLETIARYRIVVGTSLDGPEEIHNRTRGRFVQTIENSHRLQEAGLFGGVITVLNRENVDVIARFLRYLDDERILSWSLNPVYATGQGAGLLPPSEEDAWTSIRHVTDTMIESRGKRVVERNIAEQIHRFVDPPTPEALRRILTCSHPFCHAGVHVVHVTADGSIYPCGCSAFADRERYRLGSINSIKPDRYFKTLKHLHEKPNRYRQRCPSCEAASICHFGCSAFDPIDGASAELQCRLTRRMYRYLSGLQPETLKETDANIYRQLAGVCSDR